MSVSGSRVATVVADAEWLPLRLSDDLRSIRFAHIPRALHADLAYLEEKFLPAGADSVDLAVSEIDKCLADGADGAPRFIFHSSMCGSTLLARVLDQPGTSMSLQEPIILNQLSARNSRGEDVGALVATVTRLLARPFAPGEMTVVKPGNTANNLMPMIAARFPGSRALCLEASVEDLLRAVVKRGVLGRATYRRLYAFLARGGGLPTGFSPDDMWELTDLQVAALGWLIQHRDFADVLVRHPDQFRSLTLERLLNDRNDVLAALSEFFDAGWDAETVAADPRFDRHSKDKAKPYDDARRRQDAQSIDAASGPEIAWTGQWAMSLADHLALSHQLPRQLLS